MQRVFNKDTKAWHDKCIWNPYTLIYIHRYICLKRFRNINKQECSFPYRFGSPKSAQKSTQKSTQKNVTYSKKDSKK